MRIESPQNLVSVPANALCVFPAVPLLDFRDAFQIPLHVFLSLLSWALALLWLTPHLSQHSSADLMSTAMSVSANDVVGGILRTSAVVFQLVH